MFSSRHAAHAPVQLLLRELLPVVHSNILPAADVRGNLDGDPNALLRSRLSAKLDIGLRGNGTVIVDVAAFIANEFGVNFDAPGSVGCSGLVT